MRGWRNGLVKGILIGYYANLFLNKQYAVTAVELLNPSSSPKCNTAPLTIDGLGNVEGSHGSITKPDIYWHVHEHACVTGGNVKFRGHRDTIDRKR